jgi:DinB family protein
MSIVLRILLVMGVLCPPAFAQGMKDGDRQRLLAHLDMTENWLVSELDGLTNDQLKFHMSPESWNIMEVVEHLAIAEPQYWEQVKESMRQPPSGKRPEASDAGILWYGIDRTNRSKTGEARVPKGKWQNVGESLAEFRKLRRTIRDYAANTRQDPRSRMLLEGNMDVYQWLLMISSHAQRHILQIREIKSHSGYPRPAAR